MIARKTLIAKKREGGLDLIDISAIRDALRVKLIGRFLDSKRQHPWKDTLAGPLAKYGERSSYNLYAFSPRNVTGGFPGFYREVLEAWDKFLPQLRPDVEYKEHVIRLPFLNSPFFSHKGRPLVSKALREAGLTTLGGVCGRGGDCLFFDKNKTLTGLKRAGGVFKTKQIMDLGMSITQGVEKSWRTLTSRGMLMQDDAVKFLLCQGAKSTSLPQIKTKVIYDILIQKLIKRPAAELRWAAIFPTKTVTSIWCNLAIPFLSHAVFNTDFKLRHRRYYSSIVLHQIHKLKFQRLCPVCGLEDEDFEHLILRCGALSGFKTYVCQFLKTGCGATAAQLAEWDRVWLFGLLRQGRGGITMQVNTLLSFARHAAVLRRNYALFENKKVNVKELFKNLLKAHLGLLHAWREEVFTELFISRTALCKVGEGGGLVFNF
ncbi:hypothetical protein VZT92_022931 [Zoarces viviparus]|uniref:Reverse transcriptase zinc-binding domain-containing protein n=1 Tax=Zoarces viviparus TaxID=48416 RepID=A0AAW1E623_ZOAVI